MSVQRDESKPTDGRSTATVYPDPDIPGLCDVICDEYMIDGLTMGQVKHLVAERNWRLVSGTTGRVLAP